MKAKDFITTVVAAALGSGLGWVLGHILLAQTRARAPGLTESKPGEKAGLPPVGED